MCIDTHTYLTSSVVEHLLMYDMLSDRSLMVDPMYYPVCGMVHIKDTLLLMGAISPWSSGRMFPLVLSVHYVNLFQLSLDENNTTK